MHGYFSLDIICSSKLTVFLELRSQKTVHFSEQIISADKYECIFSRQMEAIVYLFYNTLILLTVDGGFSDWSNWTACSASCGTGFQIRKRTCTSPPPMYGGKLCESNSSTEVRSCSIAACDVKGKRCSSAFTKLGVIVDYVVRSACSSLKTNVLLVICLA